MRNQGQMLCFYTEYKLKRRKDGKGKGWAGNGVRCSRFMLLRGWGTENVYCREVSR